MTHCEEIPILVFNEFPETSDDASSRFSEDTYDEETPLNDRAPQPLSQNELNDLVRDLNLPKCSAELLTSRLKEKIFLKIAYESVSTAIDTKSSFLVSLKKATWYTAQILFSFCIILEHHNMKQKIGDFSLIAV